LDPPVFKNLASFIAHMVTRNWQMLGINSFLVFKNLTKTDTRNYAKTSLFGFHPVSKKQILKNWWDPNRD
jgi:hypothetical protein